MPSPMPIKQEQACLSQILFVDATFRVNATNHSAIFIASDATSTNQFRDEILSIATPIKCGGIWQGRSGYELCLISGLVPAGCCQTIAANSSQAGQNACQSSCLLLQDVQCQSDWASSSSQSRSRAALNNRSASPSRPALRACLATRK